MRRGPGPLEVVAHTFRALVVAGTIGICRKMGDGDAYTGVCETRHPLVEPPHLVVETHAPLAYNVLEPQSTLRCGDKVDSNVQPTRLFAWMLDAGPKF